MLNISHVRKVEILQSNIAVDFRKKQVELSLMN